jgi:hypothetical protein
LLKLQDKSTSRESNGVSSKVLELRVEVLCQENLTKLADQEKEWVKAVFLTKKEGARTIGEVNQFNE